MIYRVNRRKLIYVYGIGDAAHHGLLKIGMTTCDGDVMTSARKRIADCTRTAGIPFKLLHAEIALTDDGQIFSDHDVHRQLQSYRARITGTGAREWFRIDLDTAKAAIAAVKHGQPLPPPEHIGAEIILRPEQEEAVAQAVNCFKQRGNNRFLMNAKMRFGKTFCALEVVRRMKFAKTIIVTHRPVVDDGWFDDYRKIFNANPNHDYGSVKRGTSLENLLASGKNFVYFASIQDLRGSDTVGGKFDKNSAAFATDWDCVIVDEAHEGTQTALGDKVIRELVKPVTKFLALSGTPFNIIDDYDEESVYTWDYIAEQRAKADWDKTSLDDNPYADLPQMNILTYDLGKLLNVPDCVEGTSFNFREFFRTDNDTFVHATDVENFLDLLVKRDDNNYPFSRRQWLAVHDGQYCGIKSGTDKRDISDRSRIVCCATTRIGNSLHAEKRQTPKAHQTEACHQLYSL